MGYRSAGVCPRRPSAVPVPRVACNPCSTRATTPRAAGLPTCRAALWPSRRRLGNHRVPLAARPPVLVRPPAPPARRVSRPAALPCGPVAPGWAWARVSRVACCVCPGGSCPAGRARWGTVAPGLTPGGRWPCVCHGLLANPCCAPPTPARRVSRPAAQPCGPAALGWATIGCHWRLARQCSCCARRVSRCVPRRATGCLMRVPRRALPRREGALGYRSAGVYPRRPWACGADVTIVYARTGARPFWGPFRGGDRPWR